MAENSPSVVVFVNRKSGGRMGERIFKEFESIVGSMHCFFMDTGLQDGLKRCVELLKQSGDAYERLLAKGNSDPKYQKDPKLNLISVESILRVLVAGGDGTVGWLLTAMDNYEDIPKFVRIPVAHLPLGTGNDFARSTNWGGGYDGGGAEQILQDVKVAEVHALDRWKMELEILESNEKQDYYFQNYCSFGCDAAIAYEFHHLRETHPEKFTGRIKNKTIYTQQGTKVLVTRKGGKIKKHISIASLDKPDILYVLPNMSQTIIIENVPSYMGGADIWGVKGETVRGFPCVSNPQGKNAPTEGFKPQDMGDHVLEAVAFQGPLHQGVSPFIGYTGRRVAQANGFTIQGQADKTWYAQVDGEPWIIGNRGFQATITLASVSSVLIRNGAKARINKKNTTSQ